MPLTRQDALRLLRFCLGPDDSGSVELADDGAALVTISPAEPSIGVRTFEAPTFEAALRQAADARLLKAACVEKQIVFLEMGAAKAPADAHRRAARPGAARPELFPEAARGDGEPAARNPDRARHVGDLRRVVGADLQARARAAARARGRCGASGSSRYGASSATWWARRWRAGSITPRSASRSWCRRGTRSTTGGAAPAEIVDSYTQANAELLGVGDGALVSYASGDNRPSALACVVLLYAKEKTGIERARIGAAIAARSVSDEDRRALAALTAARTSYLHVFAATAPRPAEQLMERALASATYAELTRMEEMLLSGRETELGIDARAWFNVISHEMDHMGEIGTAALGLVGGEI